MEMTNECAIDLIKQLIDELQEFNKGHILFNVTRDEFEALDFAVNAIDQFGCGCGLCLSHNNMQCPKLVKIEPVNDSPNLATEFTTAGFTSVTVVSSIDLPICPYCKVPTRRMAGPGMTTLVYYPPIYDANGINTNPDRNTVKDAWTCLDCNKTFNVINGIAYPEGVNNGSD